MILEIDMQVLASGCLGAALSVSDKPGADPLAARPGGHHGVLQPRMNEAIPEHVDEADKIGSISRDYPAEAMPVHKVSPVPFGVVVDLRAERLGVQRIDLLVSEKAPPLVDRGHKDHYRVGWQDKPRDYPPDPSPRAAPLAR